MRGVFPRAVLLTGVVWCMAVFGGAVAAVAAKPFGIRRFSMQVTRTREVSEGAGRNFVNEPYTLSQAGSHPWALSSTVEFENEELHAANGDRAIVPSGDPKDVVVDLPPGLLGDPMATPRCSLTLLLGKFAPTPICPADTQVGVFRVRWFDGEKEEIGPIVNVTPEAGQSAEFALEANPTFLETGHLVHTAQGYGLSVVSDNAPMGVGLVEVEETFWGVPADPSHDPMRGLFCLRPGATVPMCDQPKGQPADGGAHLQGAELLPFLTLPTGCAAGPEQATIHGDSWERPGEVVEGPAVTIPGATGCDLLRFDPSITVEPDTTVADEPVALGVKLEVPLLESAEANATPQLRNSTIVFPEGVSISPGIVDGIQACNEFGPEGINITGPESEAPGVNGELQLAPGHCPNASTVGTAEAVIPLLPTPVKGHVYLARPGCGNEALGQSPCTEQDALDGNLYRLYLELGGTGEMAKTGVHYKVAFDTQANPATGQLTTRVLETPQAPFSELRVDLNGGPRAPLDTPAVCGPAVTTADFTPWSAPGVTPQGIPMAGTPDATPSSYFDVTDCQSPPPFSPGFVAGTVTPQAGKFSAFTLELSRKDREQYIKGIQVHTPPGLLALLASVPLCGEAQANAGTCSDASKIGTTRVASGAGSHPFEIEGDVYLTGPYRGAPFGLSVVTHVTAGPFDLGLVVVRARIEIDRETATARITTDESGPHALPQIVFGVPVRLRRVSVNIDRPKFMLNPTNCSQQSIQALVSGSQQALAGRPSPFAVGGCKSLVFKPRFTVSTNAHTSRAIGASLDTKLSYPKGALGNDANIARVKVDLPKQLPSRLSTLQKACPAAKFERDPAACPPGSIVGIARSRTPLLPVGLEGPVYFVSHGGEAFPSLVIVLQGDGVRVDLKGTTFINEKTNVTSSTFKSVPDVPVDSFELYLPQGRDSALAAVGSLCRNATKLKMPTEFVAQNGAVFKQVTKIAVKGCHRTRRRRAKGARARRSAREQGDRKGRAAK